MNDELLTLKNKDYGNNKNQSRTYSKGILSDSKLMREIIWPIENFSNKNGLLMFDFSVLNQ